MFLMQMEKPRMFYVNKFCYIILQLHEGEKPVVEVDGWNAWFYDNLNQLVSQMKNKYLIY